MQHLRADFRRYREHRSLVNVLLHQGFWATAEYRFGRWARTGAPRALRIPLKAVSVFTRKLIEILTGIEIQPTAKIGPGLHINHFGGIFIHGNVIIGDRFGLSHATTIGNDFRTGKTPVIGNGVDVFPGAVIAGGLSIGHGAQVGANTFLRTDLPARHIASGNPATIRPLKEG